MIAGPVLALATWAVALIAVGAAGLAPAAFVLKSASASRLVRHSLWWGSSVVVAAVLLASLVTGLRSPAAAVIVVGAVVLSLVVFLTVARRHVRLRPARRLPMLATLGAVTVAAVAFAIAAMGPVTNYDTGLYHLGAIAYAGDVGTVKGLANVYFGLGYANAEFPLAAFLGNGPWDGAGYRLLNALVVLLLAADVVLRLRERRGAASLIGVTGLTLVLVSMLGLADYWVISPTSDSAVFALTVASLTALAEAANARRPVPPGLLSILIAVLAWTLRPTVAPFALLVAAVVALLIVRRRGLPMRGPVTLTAAMIIVLAALQTLRDRLLSGWLQYPLSVLPFDVPWRAVDPVDARAATLGTARDPEHLWQAASGWDWVRPWVTALPGQWETWACACLLAGILIALPLALRRGAIGWRRLALVVAPPAAMAVFWFLFTPPSFRFGWGPVFGTGIVVFGWLASRLPRPTLVWPLVLRGSSVAVIVVAVGATWVRADLDSRTLERDWRLGPVAVSYVVTPIREASVESRVLESGLTVMVPTSSDQCWERYPLCSPDVPATLHPLGPGWADGLAP